MVIDTIKIIEITCSYLVSCEYKDKLLHFEVRMVSSPDKCYVSQIIRKDNEMILSDKERELIEEEIKKNLLP